MRLKHKRRATMTQTLTVQIKQVYGTEKIYPVSKEALIFAQLLGQTTLTRSDINKIKQLGYEIAVATETINF
jgi:hypothetical protein